jgi:TonB family protein
MRLLESGKRRGHAALQTAASGMLHVAVIGAALYATAGAAPGIPGRLRDTAMVYLPPPSPRVSVPTPPVVAPAAIGPPRGFQTVPLVLDIPTRIPPMDLTVPFNRDDWSGVGKPGGQVGTPPADSSHSDAPLVVNEVDEAVTTLFIPAPRYPPALRAAAIEGEVVVVYVVDTTGRVEPASWQVLKASHDGFPEAAREAILAGTFTPARVAGRPVRQLVQQTIRFAIR